MNIVESNRSIWNQWLFFWDWMFTSYYGAPGLVLIIVLILLRRKIVGLGFVLLRRWIKISDEDKVKLLLQPLHWLFVVVVIHLYAANRHQLFYQDHLQTWFRILYIAIAAWGFVQITRFFGARIKDADHVPSLSRTVRSLLYQAISILIVVFAVMMIIAELGYDMNGLLAGIGLGGLAVALAAQDMLANLFACVLIVFDKPFALNDWIQTADLEGIVEDISFRSCRVRTFDNALVSVPNSKLTNDLVINWSKMTQRKLLVYIGVTYETSQQSLETCIAKIRKVLASNADVVVDSIYVYFHSMNSMNMDFRVQCNIHNKGFASFLQVREKIHYEILQIVRDEGVHFAAMPLMNDWLKR